MTRYDILTKIAMWLKDEYKVVCVVGYKEETIKVEFPLLRNECSVTLMPLYRWYGKEEDNFNECDLNYLYRYCCRKVEHEWIKVLKHEI